MNETFKLGHFGRDLTVQHVADLVRANGKRLKSNLRGEMIVAQKREPRHAKP